MRSIVCLLLVTLALLASSCEKPNPVQEVMDLIQVVERLVQVGDVEGVAERVSDDYRDDRGYDKRAIQGILAMTMRDREIHLWKRVERIDVVEPGRVEALVFIAVAAQPILGPDKLANLQAELLRFDAVVVKEDDAWRVVAARWSDATLIDFL